MKEPLIWRTAKDIERASENFRKIFPWKKVAVDLKNKERLEDLDRVQNYSLVERLVTYD